MGYTPHSPTHRVRFTPLAILVFAATWMPTLARAHHDMDGEAPMTFIQGLGSGLAHPIIGLDHLAVLLLLGGVCGAMTTTGWPVLSFAALSIIGCLLHAGRVAWPLAELSLAVSVVAAAPLAWLIVRRSPGKRGALLMLGLFGLLHGYAYGGAIVGAGPSALSGYATGLLAIQLSIMAGAAWLAAKRASWLTNRTRASSL